MPEKISMRLSSLRDFGGDLHCLFDVRRFDNGYHSKGHRKHWCHKDDRSFKAWQHNSIKSIKEATNDRELHGSTRLHPTEILLTVVDTGHEFLIPKSLLSND